MKKKKEKYSCVLSLIVSVLYCAGRQAGCFTADYFLKMTAPGITNLDPFGSKVDFPMILLLAYPLLVCLFSFGTQKDHGRQREAYFHVPSLGRTLWSLLSQFSKASQEMAHARHTG